MIGYCYKIIHFLHYETQIIDLKSFINKNDDDEEELIERRRIV
jgi:hypothetical protein